MAAVLLLTCLAQAVPRWSVHGFTFENVHAQALPAAPGVHFGRTQSRAGEVTEIWGRHLERDGVAVANKGDTVEAVEAVLGAGKLLSSRPQSGFLPPLTLKLYSVAGLNRRILVWYTGGRLSQVGLTRSDS